MLSVAVFWYWSCHVLFLLMCVLFFYFSINTVALAQREEYFSGFLVFFFLKKFELSWSIKGYFVKIISKILSHVMRRLIC